MLATNPAIIVGFGKTKGRIEKGFDADLMVRTVPLDLSGLCPDACGEQKHGGQDGRRRAPRAKLCCACCALQVWDPDEPADMSPAANQHLHKHSAYETKPLQGRVLATYVGGSLVFTAEGGVAGDVCGGPALRRYPPPKQAAQGAGQAADEAEYEEEEQQPQAKEEM